MAAPTGRAAKPTKFVPKAIRTPLVGSTLGKNCELRTSAAALPYRKKSYHSIDVPIVEAMTARRNCCRVARSLADIGATPERVLTNLPRPGTCHGETA